MNLLFRNLILITGLFYSVAAGSQAPVELLEKWAKLNPIEKVYLHFDRDHYVAGETAWFRAYLSSDHLPDTISTSLQVELVSINLNVEERVMVPVFAGTAAGQLQLPDTLRTGMYTIRAFTPSMAGQSPDFIFRKGIYINGKKAPETNAVAKPKLMVDFFPEGGNLVTGFVNMIAFKAVDEYGLPVSVKGVVRNSKGEELVSFSDYHDGMGMFELTPVEGEKYMATVSGPVTQTFILPDPVGKGIALSVIPHPQGNFFEIHQRTNDPSFTAAYLIGQMEQRVVFRHEIKAAKESLQGVIDTRHLHSGILQVTVFNKEGLPLAERLCFVNNREYLQTASLLADTLNFSARGRNRFRIAMPDTVQGSISVSVTDADYETTLESDENILSTLLLTSDLKGYVHRPAYYFSAQNDSVTTAADLLMMTNGWRRFKWSELAKHNLSPVAQPAYITLAGRATLKGTNRSFGDKSLLLLMNNMGDQKSRNTYMLQTDKEGNFLIDSLLFFDRHRLIFSDVRGKKSQYIDIKLMSDTLRRPFSTKGFETAPFRPAASLAAARWQQDYNELLKEKGLLLEGITIKVKKKTPMEIVEDRYTSGMFSGDAVRAIDLVHSDEAFQYANIFDYLQTRVPGLQIANDGADYSVGYRQGASMSSLGTVPMTLILDEVETDAAVIATIPASQVALVKVYQSFVGAWGNAPGGVLSIYTKKLEDMTSSGIVSSMIIYNGYSVVKEFYAPDHSQVKKTEKPDNRITLDWRPGIFINNINPRIPFSFYNNDRTRRFRVVVAGMTTAGKLVWLEKIFAAK